MKFVTNLSPWPRNRASRCQDAGLRSGRFAMTLSPRLAAIVDALPIVPGMRVLEIGCGPGAVARALAARIGGGFVLGIDRSAKAIAQARAAGVMEIAAKRLDFRQARVEDFRLDGEAPFDLAFAVRVGA